MLSYSFAKCAPGYLREDGRLTAEAECVVLTSLVMGWHAITPKNLDDLADRYHFYQSIYGPLGVDDDGRFIELTRVTLAKYVGLETNVRAKEAASWAAEVGRNWMKSRAADRQWKAMQEREAVTS